MKIQLALDRLTREESLNLISETYDQIDWIEVGTGVIKEYGMAIIREIKESFPEKTIVADMKTCDAGAHEAAQAFDAGADITTVMAFSSNKTIQDTLEVAIQYKKRIMIDLLGVDNRERVSEIHSLGADLVSLHYGKDMQKDGELNTYLFELVKDISDLEVAIAGGINLETLPDILKKEPSIVIVGSAITKSDDGNLVAIKMKELIRDYAINY